MLLRRQDHRVDDVDMPVFVGLGKGTMERAVIYPVILWLIGYGYQHVHAYLAAMGPGIHKEVAMIRRWTMSPRNRPGWACLAGLLAALALLATFAILVAASACGSGDQTGDLPGLDDGSAAGATASGSGATAPGPTGAAAVAGAMGSVDPGAPGGATGSDWILTGADARWPDYIPNDIPPLEAPIRKIMQGATGLRIFYEELSRDQVEDYLALLKQNGFEVQYVVYVQEGFPDNSEERIAAGDFDAVNISKGAYRMDIGYGGRPTTLDIETSGFEDAYPFTPERDWPGDLAGVIPQPERCRIEAVYAQDGGGYQIVATPQDATAVADYVQALLAAGYAPKASPLVARPPVGGDYEVVYGRDDVELTVDHSESVSTARITIWRVDMAGFTPWPNELVGLVPQPAGAPVQMLTELGELDWIIQCAGSGEVQMPTYIDQLVVAGFTETGQTQRPGGGQTTINLEKAGLKVSLTLASTGELVIQITDEP